MENRSCLRVALNLVGCRPSDRKRLGQQAGKSMLQRHSEVLHGHCRGLASDQQGRELPADAMCLPLFVIGHSCPPFPVFGRAA